MLFLIGLMGLMAVSAVAYVDLFGEEEEQGPIAQGDQTASDAAGVTDLLLAAEPLEEKDHSAALWPSTDGPVEINDFDTARDALLCVWDDSAGHTLAPEVDLRADPARDGHYQIWSGSTLLATVKGQGQNLGDLPITLMPQSAVMASGLIAAS